MSGDEDEDVNVNVNVNEQVVRHPIPIYGGRCLAPLRPGTCLKNYIEFKEMLQGMTERKESVIGVVTLCSTGVSIIRKVWFA
ncbi:hypothetical protein [Paenibacillus sp. SN-8-1]|uniref:hypothetical protein n=1 Tax=Paenibacillus sp. SN-8-1 TaxID=3435409 RepID=UPI003D9A6DD7